MEGRFERVNMLLSEGALEIMERISELGVGRFSDFRELNNDRTGKRFSANTISARLKELFDAGAIENDVEGGPGKKKSGYKLTPNGKKALELSIEYEKKLEGVLPQKR